MILVFADEIWSESAWNLPNREGVDTLLNAATTAGIVNSVEDDEDAEGWEGVMGTANWWEMDVCTAVLLSSQPVGAPLHDVMQPFFASIPFLDCGV